MATIMAYIDFMQSELFVSLSKIMCTFCAKSENAICHVYSENLRPLRILLSFESYGLCQAYKKPTKMAEFRSPIILVRRRNAIISKCFKADGFVQKCAIAIEPVKKKYCQKVWH